MPVTNVEGVGDNGSIPTIATARDIGNIAAGYVAGDNGLTWKEARFGFDLLESRQKRNITTEAMVSQLAERMGWKLGIKNFKAEHPWRYSMNPPDDPFPPK